MPEPRQFLRNTLHNYQNALNKAAKAAVKGES